MIGAEPMSVFEGRRGLELVEKVQAALPPVSPTFTRASRRQVLQAIHRLLVLAAYPAKLISASPFRRDFCRRSASDKAKTYLYPDEDARLMACADVPLVTRLCYGILIREGFRVSELLGLTWSDVDLDRGVVVLDENKTDDPRSWILDPGVVEALRRWKEHFAWRPDPIAPILRTHETGGSTASISQRSTRRSHQGRHHAAAALRTDRHETPAACPRSAGELRDH